MEINELPLLVPLSPLKNSIKQNNKQIQKSAQTQDCRIQGGTHDIVIGISGGLYVKENKCTEGHKISLSCR